MKKIFIFLLMVIGVYFINIEIDHLGYISRAKVEKDIENFQKEIGKKDNGVLIEEINQKFPNLDEIDPKQRIKVYSILAYLYLENTNYAKTSEINLKIIKLAKKLKDETRYIKAHIELALLFRRIGGIESGINLLKKVESIDIADKEKNADIKVYSLLNLFQLYFEIKEYSLAENALRKIIIYKKYFNEEDWRDIEILIANDYAELYLEEKNYNKCKEYLDLSLKKQSIDKEEYYHGKNIPYKLTLAAYYINTGKIESGKEIYENLLKEANRKENSYLELKILSKLEKIEKDPQKKINYLERMQKLSNEEKRVMYENYTESIIDLIKYDLKDLDGYKFKNRVYRFIVILLSVLTYSGYCLKKTKVKSEYDGLSGVYNRSKFDEDFYTGKKKWKSIGLIVTDIDNFKKLNDTYGHSFGDKILKENSEIISEYCKKNKGVKIYRYGGEEFVLLCKNKRKNEIRDIAEDIRQLIERKEREYKLEVTISVGCSYSENEKRDNLFEKADDNLYISKENGKNRVTF